MLLKTIEDLRKYIPRLSTNYSWANIAPFITLAEQKYIIPYIGFEFYSELATAYAGTPTAKQTAAINQLQPSIAYYTMLEALPHLGMQIGNAGVGQGQSDTTQPTPQWKEFKIEANYCSNAETFLDQALQFLELAPALDYPIWVTSPEYTLQKTLFIHNAKELNSCIPIFQSRRAFIALKYFIADVQNETIIPVLGKDLYDAVLVKHINGTLSTVDKELIRYIQKPLANIAARKAFNQLAVEFNGRGFRILSDSDAIIQKTAASAERLQPLLRDLANNGETYLIALKKYLQDNADQFPLYKASTAFIDNSTSKPWELPDNSISTSFMT